MTDFLTVMAEASGARAQSARREVPEPEIRARALDAPEPPALTLSTDGFDVIAELKLVSPSAGTLRDNESDIVDRVLQYAGAGAAAVSVLTEPTRFGGSLDHLRKAAAALAPHGIPAMRKDFLVDPYQVFEARAAGAGGVLVIARMLSDADLLELVTVAVGLGMFVLMEAFDARDLERIGELAGDFDAGAPILAGLNTRDLTTLKVDRNRLNDLANVFPPGIPKVAESGIGTPEQVREVAARGYRMALVGTALMRADDPGTLLRTMIAAGRAG